MATTLQSPGPGYRALRFSDGTSTWMPPEATAQHWQMAKDQGEAALDQKYMAQAQAENRPITTQDKTYSATAVRPNTPYGHLMGWLDHNLGGNALNRSSAAPVIQSAKPAISSAERIATGAVDAIPVVGAADLASTGINVGKHLAAKVAPALNSIPDLPTASGWLRNVTNTPPLDPNAPEAQKIAENVFSTMANPNAVLGPTIARTTGAEAGSQVGQQVAGEPGQFVGSFLGASPESMGNPLLHLSRYGLGGKQAEEVAQAGDRTGIQPTFGMMANPTGRLINKALAAVPIVGGPIKQAQETADTAIGQAQREISERLYGAPLPSEVGPGSIGDALIRGARQGAANLTQKAQDEQQTLAQNIGPNQPTNLRGVYQPAAQQQFTTSPTTYAPLAARLQNLRDMAVQAQTPRFQAVSGPMPAGAAPYQRVMNARSDLGAEIPGVSGMAGGVQKDLYARLTQAMRDAAVAKDPSLGPMFDYANENYQRIMGQGGERSQLEEVGGQPVQGYSGTAQPGGTVFGAPFRDGKDEGQAYNYFTGKLNSPSSLDVFSDPTIVPNDFWRQVTGSYLSTLGKTKEETYRPDIMAQQWGKIDPGVREQMFAGPTGQPLAGVSDMNDLATLGRNSVVPISRAGLTNTAGSVLGIKWLLDAIKQTGGVAAAGLGGRALASGMESPTFVNAMSGNITPLTDSLYNGLPAATQTILQNQNNQQ